LIDHTLNRRKAEQRTIFVSEIILYAGIVLAKLGARVVATDLGPNLTLQENCFLNGGEIWQMMEPKSKRPLQVAI